MGLYTDCYSHQKKYSLSLYQVSSVHDQKIISSVSSCASRVKALNTKGLFFFKMSPIQKSTEIKQKLFLKEEKGKRKIFYKKRKILTDR